MRHLISRSIFAGVLVLVCAAGLAFTSPARAADTVPAQPPAILVKQVADAVLRDFPQPPPFDWGEGVLMTGMLEAHELTSDPRYLAFVQRWADHWSEAGIQPVLKGRPGKLQGYCGHWGPGYPVLMLYEHTHEPRYLAMANQITDFMLTKAERTRDGGLSHFDGKVQLWLDTLDMSCPVLARAAVITRRPELGRESLRQLEIYAKHLQDPNTGLFFHMYDEASGKATAPFWARGNGWVVMASIEALKNEPPDSEARRRWTRAFELQLRTLASLQDPRTGRWHTVLDDPDTYLETSASAMFLYGMAEARRLKLSEIPSQAMLDKAWAGLATQVDGQGRVIGVSGGTTPSAKEGYANKPTGTYTWGTGAFLMAACAYAELEAATKR
ncbi:MAG: glycoside hydrolase family 88/105 protein [Pirellulales bacterium]